MNRRKIEDLLDNLGINISSQGYTYWVDLIEMYLRDINRGKRDLEKYYKELAIVHETTRNAVERCIRYAYINSGKIIQEYFKIKYKVRTKQLLELIIREIRRGDK